MSSELFESAHGYVEVAIPVPLRRTFTYRVPAALAGELGPGSRVAVPFGARKLAGFVLGPVGAPPPGTRLKDIAGRLDALPLFTEELLRFLREAADYYVHPIGEVLRAAAPALPSEAMAALRKDGFLDQGETLPGTRIATRAVLVAQLLPGMPAADTRLGKNQSLLVQLLRERGEVTLDELRRHVANPRAVLRALVDKAIVTTVAREVAADRFFEGAVQPTPAPEPNPAQAAAIAAIIQKLGAPGGFLLHGVTGSGKTEVYLRVIAEARAARAGRAGAGAGDRAHAAAGGALPRALRRRRRGAAQRAAASASGSARGARCARARCGSRSARARRCSRRCASWAWSSSTRSTTARSSRKRACATTRATWRWCARSAPARCACSARRRRRSRARSTPSAARFARLALPSAPTPRPLPPVEIVDLRAPSQPGPTRHRCSAPAARGDRRDARGGRAGDPVPEPARLRDRSCCAAACGARRSLPALRGVADLPPGARDRLVCHYCGFDQRAARALPECGAPTRSSAWASAPSSVEAVVRERFPDGARGPARSRHRDAARSVERRARRGVARAARSTSWSARRW